MMPVPRLQLLALPLLALFSSCGTRQDDESTGEGTIQVQAQHLFDRKDWTVEYQTEILDEATIRHIREAEKQSDSFVWISMEAVPWWRLVLAGPSEANPKCEVYRVDTEFPLAGSFLDTAPEDIVLVHEEKLLNRSSRKAQVRQLGENEYAVVASGVYVCLAGGSNSDRNGCRLTYPTAMGNVQVMRGLAHQGEGLPRTFGVTFLPETNNCILLPPPSKLSLPIQLIGKSELQLRFALGSQSFLSASKRIVSTVSQSDGVGFAVQLFDPSGVAAMEWRQFVAPNQVDKFLNARIPIDVRDGSYTLELSTFSSQGNAALSQDDFAILAEPILVTERSEDRPVRPNVIWIVLDTLRADTPSYAGGRVGVSPNLDRFAGEATWFMETRSPSSWTLPSHASMFTSQQPNQHGVLLGSHRLADEFLTVAEILRFNGWRTAGFSDGGFMDPRFGLCQGFDSFSAQHEPLQDKVKTVANWLETNRAPFFLFMQSFQVHSPYDPPEPFRSRFVEPYEGELPHSVSFHDLEAYWRKVRANPDPRDVKYVKQLYDAELAYADDAVGKLLARVKEMGLWDNTLIMITSDHGDEFWDHGDHNHGATLYEETVRVPLLVHYPGAFYGGQKVANPVQLIDLAPTILQLADLPMPPVFSGISLVDRDAPRSYLGTIGEKLGRAAMSDERAHATVADGWKFISAPKDYFRGVEGVGDQLFNLSSDPRELNNLLGNGAQLRMMQDRVHALVEQYKLSSAGGFGDVTLTADALRLLQSLGYLHGESTTDK